MTLPKPEILIVDDRKENLIALEALLEDCDAVVKKAFSGNEALSLTLKHNFALVLLDVQMPGMDGFEVAELMRLNARTKHIPIIFVTAISKKQTHIFKGYESGAVDYLPKPIEPLILRSKVKIFLDLWRQQQKLNIVIAESTKLATELSIAKKEAEAANRAKTEFLATMSHDIRTPMNAILGMGEVLQESGLTSEQSHALKVLNSAGSNLLTLINDILDLSKVEAGQLRMESIPFDLHELTLSTGQILLHKAQAKKIGLNVHNNSDCPRYVMGDPGRLRQVLLNLIGNAVKFTDIGRVSLTVEPFGKDTIRFTVTDTGIGISEGHLKRIFDPFRQAEDSTTRRFGGTGLGLSICQRLVQAMGGDITVESNKDKGSAFQFTALLAEAEDVPVVDEQIQDTPQTPGPTQKAPLNILLVDDVEENRMVISSFLNQTNNQITEVVNGEEAVQEFISGSYDLVLMDMQMPVLDGFNATQRIRAWEKNQQRQPTQIIALTASAMREDMEKTIQAGCDKHLSKPIKKAHLLDVINRLPISQPQP
ncbi:MAG: response regulator [Magnetococcales bacterium]|nr:response regulator [Magnetococcales bacterium]